MRLIDTHAHLEQVAEIAQALERARASGVNAIVAVGMDLSSNKRILELASDEPGFVFPALGIHPWAIEEPELDAIFEFIEANIHDCVAVGEIGLDYWIKKNRALQREVFARLLKTASEYDKPVITHSRGSYEDLLGMVKESGIDKAVFHWFSGPLEVAADIIKSGYYISATPAVRYSAKHREVIQTVPLDNLLLETDCPVKYNDIKSEPATVRVTLEEVSKLKAESVEAVALATCANSVKLFGLGGLNS